MSLPILGWLTGALFFFYAWVLRVSPSVMVDELMREFAVGGSAVGGLSAVYFYGYAGMQIPVGLLIDRFGLRAFRAYESDTARDPFFDQVVLGYLAPLQEFVLIDPDTRRIEHYRRTQSKRWELQEIEPEQPLQLQCLEVEIAWQKVFRNVD